MKQALLNFGGLVSRQELKLIRGQKGKLSCDYCWLLVVYCASTDDSGNYCTCFYRAGEGPNVACVNDADTWCKQTFKSSATAHCGYKAGAERCPGC
ncbi:MAG: hypothetical protein QM528_07020 [Phycisphaerales bacterium]|nr:hypothetical protein [Phycisphaerales bacterium]